jgi:hypothetical protein
MPLANVLCSTHAVIYTRSVMCIELLINFFPIFILVNKNKVAREMYHQNLKIILFCIKVLFKENKLKYH